MIYCVDSSIFISRFHFFEKTEPGCRAVDIFEQLRGMGKKKITKRKKKNNNKNGMWLLTFFSKKKK